MVAKGPGRNDESPSVFGGSTPEAGEPALTARGRRTRDKLVQGARRVLEEKGYAASSVADITSGSEVALGTFYRYFRNKEELYLLLLRELVETVYESTTGTWDPADPLGSTRRATQRYLAAYADNRKLVTALRDMAGSVDEAAKLWWELRMETYRRMRRTLSKDDPSENSQLDLAVIALGGMVEQFAYFCFVEGERFGRPIPEIGESAEVISQLWYSAVSKGPLVGQYGSESESDAAEGMSDELWDVSPPV